MAVVDWGEGATEYRRPLWHSRLLDRPTRIVAGSETREPWPARIRHFASSGLSTPMTVVYGFRDPVEDHREAVFQEDDDTDTGEGPAEGGCHWRGDRLRTADDCSLTPSARDSE